MSTEKLKYIPISELERLNTNWFSVGSKRFFKSLWDNYALKNEDSIYAYFISSEKHVSYFANINEPRKYTIRKVNMRNGDFNTNIDDNSIFKFQAFKTKKMAIKALIVYLKNEPIKADKLEFLKREIESKKYNVEWNKKSITRLETELKEMEV